MLGSAGSIVPKRWILGIFALGLIAVMVATSANPWAEAATVPTSVTAIAVSSTSIQVDWTAVDGGSTLPGGSPVVDAYKVDCVGTPGTVSETVSGITTETATVTDLTENIAYVCSVFAKASTTLPASGEAANSVTTPLSAATTLGSAVASLTSANVQVGGTVDLSVITKGTDSGSTAIADGFTVAWSSTSNGSVSPLTGTTTTYTASSAGNATVTVTVTQTASAIVKTDTVDVNNFTVASDPAPPAPVDPPASDLASLPDISGFDPGTAESVVLNPTSDSTTLSVVDSSDSTVSGSVNFGAGVIPTGTSVGVLTSISSATSATALPSGVTSVGDSIMSITVTDNDGNEVDSSFALSSDATVSMTLALSAVESAGVDVLGLTIWKADTTAGPWTKLSSTVSSVDGLATVTGNVRTFSVFRIGFEIRDIGIGSAGGGAVLPSAGDAAPTTTQALLVTGLGLLLIVGGGVYVRRQRRANGTV